MVLVSLFDVSHWALHEKWEARQNIGLIQMGYSQTDLVIVVYLGFCKAVRFDLDT